MKSLIPDLRQLTQFYFGLHKDLSAALEEADSSTEHSLTESILRNRIRISQIERMNAHILQLSDNLKKSRKDLSPESRAEADALAAEAKSHAIRLRELFTQVSEKIENTKSAVQEEIKGISKGKQYLKSVDPVQNNYPKFIDSTG